MIVCRNTMKEIEQKSGFSNAELMEKAGKKCAEIIAKQHPNSPILILCGNGNNGGDGAVIARYLHDVTVCLVDGESKTLEAKQAFQQLNQSTIHTHVIDEIQSSTVIVDAIYGFGFHGSIKEELRPIFQAVNQSNAYVYSIDINSGANCDDDCHDIDAIKSNLTIALDCYKPFHMLRKEHQLFQETVLADLDIPHNAESNYTEMNENLFFQHFPVKQVNDYKGTHGKLLLVAGSYGMAGAAGLNLLGARCTGASYIQCACPDSIYPIIASRYMTPVFYPFHQDNMYQVIEPILYKNRAIAFGSGAVNMPKKQELFDLILQSADCPVVLDAEGIRLLIHNYYILKFVKAPIILTPHIGEFASLLGITIQELKNNKFAYVRNFAKKYHVTIVLKGANTIVINPEGKIYINQSGNQMLAQAGSGDLLTGILCSMLSMVKDQFTAVTMAVWLHGHLADLAAEKHAKQNYYLEHFEEISNEFFYKYETGNI